MSDPISRTPEGADQGDASKAETAAVQAEGGARDAFNQAASTARDQADSAKAATADEFSDAAEALRKAAREMRSGSPQERTFGQIASSLADASDALRDKDLGTLVGDLNRFARANPLVFLGAAALLGFAATRFARASTEPVARHRSSRSADDPITTSPPPEAMAPGATVTPAKENVQ